MLESASPGGGSVCLLQGGGSAPGGGGGVSAPGGCLLWGGVCSWGGGIPACTEADPPPVNRMNADRCKNITLATTSLRPVNIDVVDQQ